MKIVKKVKNLSSPVKVSMALLIANFFHSGIMFLANPIFTRILTTQEFGVVSVYNSWVTTIGIFAMLCLSCGVFNNGMIDFKQDKDSFSFSLLMLSNIATSVIAVVIFIFYGNSQNILGLSLPLIILMFLTFLLQPAYSFWLVKQRFEYKYKLMLTISILTTIFSPLTSIICVIFIPGDKVLIKLFSEQIVMFICYIIFYINLCVKSKFKVNLSYWKYALVFNLPLIPHYLSGQIMNSADRIMISNLIDSSSAGIYSVAYSISAIMVVFWSSANASLIPYTYEKCEKKDYKSISRVTTPLVLCYAILCILVIFAAPEIMAVFAPSSYSEGVYVVPLVVGGVFFSSLYFIFANIVYYYKQPKYVMFASVIAALLNIGLNFIFIPKFGFLAAGYTTFFCYILQTFIDYLAMKKVVSAHIYNIKLLGSVSLVVTIISMIAKWLYDYNIIRYILICVIAILIFVYRKKIIYAFNSIRKKPCKED